MQKLTVQTNLLGSAFSLRRLTPLDFLSGSAQKIGKMLRSVLCGLYLHCDLVMAVTAFIARKKM